MFRVLRSAGAAISECPRPRCRDIGARVGELHCQWDLSGTYVAGEVRDRRGESQYCDVIRFREGAIADPVRCGKRNVVSADGGVGVCRVLVRRSGTVAKVPRP